MIFMQFESYWWKGRRVFDSLFLLPVGIVFSSPDEEETDCVLNNRPRI